MICPVCNSNKVSLLFNLKCKNFDYSVLYTEVNICECQNCSHVFNYITDIEYTNLMTYYEKEYSFINLNSFSTTNDMPGTLNQNSLVRYEKLYNFLIPHLENKNLNIVDIGCSGGGFLKFLKTKGNKFNLIGVEPSINYVEKAKSEGLNIINGSAENTNLDSKFADVIILDQVLEHLKDLDKVTNEIFRILKPGGIVYIGVPNSVFYDNFSFFNFYWFLLREHLQHFNIDTLTLLFKNKGLDLINYNEFVFPMLGTTTFLPCLGVVFQKKSLKTNTFILNNNKKWAFNYIKKQLKELDYLKSLNLKFDLDTYVWGIGREFFHLIAQEVVDFNSCILIDSNSYKRDNLRVNGKKIFSPFFIDCNDEDKKIVFTAIAHRKALLKQCEKMGFKGKYFFI